MIRRPPRGISPSFLFHGQVSPIPWGTYLAGYFPPAHAHLASESELPFMLILYETSLFLAQMKALQ